jgi:RND family efflux transporter MFP subunit
LALVLWLTLGHAPNEDGAVALVRRGAIEATIDALGRVEPVRSQEVVPRLSGEVLSLSVAEGDRVVAGQELLWLDDRAWRADLEQAERLVTLRQELLAAALRAPDEPTIALARGRLRRATAIRQNAQQEVDAIADTGDAEGSDEAVTLETAKIEYEMAQAEYDRVLSGPAEADLLRLRVDLLVAQQALAEAQRRLELAVVRAPIGGTVVSWSLQVGDLVFANNAVGQVADLTVLQVRAEIGELDVPELALGQTVRLRLDAFPGREITGTLSYLPPTLDTSRGAPTANTLVALEAYELGLRPGMGASLTVVLASQEGVLLLPRRAVRQVGTHQVVRVREGRQAVERIVETGLSNSTEVQILSGLNEGQTVLVD